MSLEEEKKRLEELRQQILAEQGDENTLREIAKIRAAQNARRNRFIRRLEEVIDGASK